MLLNEQKNIYAHNFIINLLFINVHTQLHLYVFLPNDLSTFYMDFLVAEYRGDSNVLRHFNLILVLNDISMLCLTVFGQEGNFNQFVWGI